MKIGINCGHTMTGPGSGAEGILSESEHTRMVGRALMEKLESIGIKTIDCTIDKAGSQSEYLASVVQMANMLDMDWFISIHFNASPSHTGQGAEVYTYKGRQYPDALAVCRNLEKLGFRNRGVKEGSGLYVIRKTKAKAMLIEVCFCDNQADVDIYNRVGGAVAVAEAIFRALCGQMNIQQQKPAENHNMTKEEFIEFIGNIAKSDWQDRRIMLPSVVVAQAMKESGCGTSELARNANALFGIKQNGWPGRVYYKDATEQNPDGSYRKDLSVPWRAYDSWEQSVLDHNEYIATRRVGNQAEPNWKNVVGETDCRLVVKYLQDAQFPYATSLTYAESLIRDYIEKYNLTRFDQEKIYVQDAGIMLKINLKPCKSKEEAEKLIDKLMQIGIDAEIATSQ